MLDLLMIVLGALILFMACRVKNQPEMVEVDDAPPKSKPLPPEVLSE